jgi:hypothetical protein
MKLAEDWRAPEIYEAMSHVNRLRADWKTSSASLADWPQYARVWVVEQSPDAQQDPSKQWFLRRTASQFIGKMGWLLQKGYFTPDELFGVIPEAGRLLLVLMPIEIAIKEHFSSVESPPLADWDRPVGKWEFRDLWTEYIK